MVSSFLSLAGLATSALEATTIMGLSSRPWSKLFSSSMNDAEILDGIGAAVGVGDIDEMDDDAGALDVAEELDAEAGAEVRAFDEAGNVGDDVAFLVWGFADWRRRRVAARAW